MTTARALHSRSRTDQVERAATRGGGCTYLGVESNKNKMLGLEQTPRIYELATPAYLSKFVLHGKCEQSPSLSLLQIPLLGCFSLNSSQDHTDQNTLRNLTTPIQ
jgi:hypothetical protein